MLVVPAIHWMLNILLVDEIMFDSLSHTYSDGNHHALEHNGTRMSFCREKKKCTAKKGKAVSTWLLGDPLVSQSWVTYEYVELYHTTFGTGYGSLPRTCSCLDLVNSY